MTDEEIKKDLADRVLACEALGELSARPEFKLLMEAFAGMAEVEKQKLMVATDMEEIRKRQFIYRFLTELFPNFLATKKKESRLLVKRALEEGLLSVTDTPSPVNGTRPVSAVGD